MMPRRPSLRHLGRKFISRPIRRSLIRQKKTAYSKAGEKLGVISGKKCGDGIDFRDDCILTTMSKV
jgi:hypothetical protein